MLLEFYGLECPHCLRMRPLVEKMETELGVKVERFETWHNTENARKQEGYDKNYCGGVPFYFNTETGKYICGEVPYEELRAWASAKKA